MAKIMMRRNSENNRVVQYLGNYPTVVAGMPVVRTRRLDRDYANTEAWIKLS